MRGELKPGYKQTEVGVIPEDWDDLLLEEITKEDSPICYGIVQVGPYTPNGVPVLAIKNLNSDYATNIHCASVGVERPYARSRIRPEDVLVSVKGTTGRVGIVPPGFHGNISRDLARLRLREGIVPRFVFQILQSDLAQRRLATAVVGTTRMELSIAILKKVRIPLPPTEAEQEAIAEALSDADALIESLEQLIAKKRQIKQGAMQELLTGKKRLPGSSGEWETRTLGDIAPLQRGFDLPNSKLQQGTYPVVYSNGVLNHHTAFQVKGPGVVTGRSGTIGTVTFIEQNFWPHNTSLWVTTFKSNDPKFVFYLYTTIGLERFATGSGVPTLNRNDVHDFKVSIPPSLAEQTAIAVILSDMDAEIAALEEKLAKARKLKQGMMQELLTGKIRLVDSEKLKMESEK